MNITAQSLDLGVAGGIVSAGPALNPALAAVPTAAHVGATININLERDLDMFASEISSYYGGAINVVIGGTLNAGLEGLPFGIPFVPYGIWTSGGSDVRVVAEGDINVAGSRIATFAGGNISVESLRGSVDAGTGNFSEIKVNEVVVDPVTHQVTTPQSPVAGGGILATTLPDAPANLAVGDIQVKAAQDISIGNGGVAQYSWNGNAGAPMLSLQAGGGIFTAPVGLSAIGGEPTSTYETTFEFNTNGQAETLVYLNYLNPPIQTVVGVTNVDLTIALTASAPFAYQWYDNDHPLPGATNAILSLPNVHRGDSGVDTVIVSNALDSFTFAVRLRVLVPQFIDRPVVLPDGTVSFSFGDYDGGILSAQDSANLVVQASPDLVNGVDLSDAIVPAGNGHLGFVDDLQTFPSPFFFPDWGAMNG